MQNNDFLAGTLLEEACLSFEELMRLAAVSPEWIARRIEAGLLEAARGTRAGEWRFTSLALQRARRLRTIERDFDANPELAALVADLLEELDRFRSKVS